MSIQNRTFENKSLFVYILFKRLKEMGIMILFATTFAGLVCMYGYFAILGVGVGVLAGISCLRYGLQGLVLMVVASFPQVIFYIPAFLYLFHLCYQLCVKLYFPHKDYWKTSGRAKVFLFKNIMFALITLVVVIIGIVMESYVNPKIFLSFIKNF